MKKIKAIWELMRLEHGIMLALGIFIGSFITIHGKGILSPDKIILTFFTALFLEASTFALNDYYDLEIDKKNKRQDRPLVRGDISAKTALYIFYILFPLGILCSYFVNFTCFTIALITAIFAIIYDAYLKKIKLLGNFYIAYTMAIPFIFGSAAVGTNEIMIGTISPSVIMVAIIAFLVGSGREIMKDIMDYKGDKESGVKSFPRYIGIQKSNQLTSLFYITAIGLSFIPFLSETYPIYYQNPIYLIFVLITDILLILTTYEMLFNKNIEYPKYRKLTLFAILTGLLAFLLGVFIG